MQPGRAHNPFSAGCLGPENLDYDFQSPEEEASLFHGLEAHGWRGELIGAHGAGKSTLLRTIGVRLEERGLRVARFRSRDERPHLPLDWPAMVLASRVCLLDGGECLPGVERLALFALCRLLRRGMILTTHNRFGWGLGVPVAVSPAKFHRLVGALLQGEASPPGADETDALLAAHGGDARSALFALYDAYESDNLRTRRGGQAVST